MILIPASTLVGLTPQQLEMIITHEIAHIRRHDLVINLFQVCVETVLFYHPAVRWMSGQIRSEREHCCDDYVVASSYDATSYARALAELEQARSLPAQFAVAASGGSLVRRIHRLIDDCSSAGGSAVVATGLMIAALILIGLAVIPFDAPESHNVDNVKPIAIPTASVAPVHAIYDPARSLADVYQSEWIAANKPTSEMPSVEPPAEPSLAKPEPVVAIPVAEPDIAAPEPLTAATAAEPVALPEPSNEPESAPAVAVPIPEPFVSVTTASKTVEPDTELDAGPKLDGGALKHVVEPRYPPKARTKALEGEVTVEFTVTESGRVKNGRVIVATNGDVFNRAALRAIRKWRFEPFRLDGEPVAQTLEQTIGFEFDERIQASLDTPCYKRTGSRLCRNRRGVIPETQPVKVILMGGVSGYTADLFNR